MSGLYIKYIYFVIVKDNFFFGIKEIGVGGVLDIFNRR